MEPSGRWIDSSLADCPNPEDMFPPTDLEPHWRVAPVVAAAVELALEASPRLTRRKCEDGNSPAGSMPRLALEQRVGSRTGPFSRRDWEVEPGGCPVVPAVAFVGGLELMRPGADSGWPIGNLAACATRADLAQEATRHSGEDARPAGIEMDLASRRGETGSQV